MFFLRVSIFFSYKDTNHIWCELILSKLHLQGSCSQTRSYAQVSGVRTSVSFRGTQFNPQQIPCRRLSAGERMRFKSSCDYLKVRFCLRQERYTICSAISGKPTGHPQGKEFDLNNTLDQKNSVPDYLCPTSMTLLAPFFLHFAGARTTWGNESTWRKNKVGELEKPPALVLAG